MCCCTTCNRSNFYTHCKSKKSNTLNDSANILKWQTWIVLYFFMAQTPHCRFFVHKTILYWDHLMVIWFFLKLKNHIWWETKSIASSITLSLIVQQVLTSLWFFRTVYVLLITHCKLLIELYWTALISSIAKYSIQLIKLSFFLYLLIIKCLKGEKMM